MPVFISRTRLAERFASEADNMFEVLKMLKDRVHKISNDDLLIASENHKLNAMEMFRANNEYVDMTGNRHVDYDRFVVYSGEVGNVYDREIAIRKQMLGDFDGRVW